MPPRRSAAGSSSHVTSLTVAASPNPPLSPADLLPADCTPGYVPADPSRGVGPNLGGLRKGKGKEREVELDKSEGPGKMTAEDKTRFMQELIDFDPTSLLYDLSAQAEQEISSTLDGLTGFMNSFAGQVIDRLGDGERNAELAVNLEREVESGLTTLESLLLSHTSNAFDLLSSWALRNAFGFKEGLVLTLPAHQGLDFPRGQWVAGLPDGEGTLREELEVLRTQVEDMRKLKYKLELADRQMDRKVALMEKTKEEVGFVARLSEEAGLTPLAKTSQGVVNNLTALHENLTQLELVPPPPVPTYPTTAGSAPGPKEWEYGRAAYLNWATKQAMRPVLGATAGGSAGMDVDEAMDTQLAGREQEEATARGKEAEVLAKMRDGVRGVASEEGLLKMSGSI